MKLICCLLALAFTASLPESTVQSRRAVTAFLGTWVLEVDTVPRPVPGRSGRSVGLNGGAFGPQFTLSQDGPELVLTRMLGERKINSAYNIDGAPSRNQELSSVPPTVSVLKFDPKAVESFSIVTRFAEGETGTLEFLFRLSGELLAIEAILSSDDPAKTTRNTSNYRRQRVLAR